jgi:hypothetical protein
MADKAELREQMEEAFGEAELNTKLGGGDFPYESVEAFVDDVLANLEEQGEI